MANIARLLSYFTLDWDTLGVENHGRSAYGGIGWRPFSTLGKAEHGSGGLV